MFQTYKCPLCKAELKPTPHCYRDMNCFASYADCSRDIWHCEIYVSWNDPKKIRIVHEDVRFAHEDRFYIVKKTYGKEIHNDITIAPLDECGNEDMDQAKEISLKGNLFNFKHFSPEKFANRVNVSRVFY